MELNVKTPDLEIGFCPQAGTPGLLENLTVTNSEMRL